MVAYAYERVPHYRRLFTSLGLSAAMSDIDEFQRLPLLTKETIRSRGDELLSDAFEKEDLIMAKTGGSTGKPLQIYFDEACLRSDACHCVHHTR